MLIVYQLRWGINTKNQRLRDLNIINESGTRAKDSLNRIREESNEARAIIKRDLVLIKSQNNLRSSCKRNSSLRSNNIKS